jgi:hypothetical protein
VAESTLIKGDVRDVNGFEGLGMKREGRRKIVRRVKPEKEGSVDASERQDYHVPKWEEQLAENRGR